MALAADRNLSIRNTQGQRKKTCVVATGQTIYKHALVVLKAAGTSCKVAANETTTTFLGLSDAHYTAGATAVLYTNIDVSIPLKTGVTAGNRGAKAYAADDEKCYDLATLGPPIGTFMEIDSANSANIWVHLGETPLGTAS